MAARATNNIRGNSFISSNWNEKRLNRIRVDSRLIKFCDKYFSNLILDSPSSSRKSQSELKPGEP